MKDTDFIGFSFNGVTSKSLGIYHVSDGSRYNENLIPNLQDKTANIEGGDGTLYWNSFYTNRPWTLQCAFDNVSELQLRRMRQVFSARQVGRLVFDEVPYKYYIAKVSATPQIRYICFNELNNPNDEEQGTHRVYKGDLTIQMVSYFPFAKSIYKFLDEYTDTNLPQWSESAVLLESQTDPSSENQVDVFKSTGSGTNEWGVSLYNPGDLDADFTLYLNITKILQSTPQVYIKLQQKTGDTANQYSTIKVLNFKSSSSWTRINNDDVWIRFNSRSQLLEGCYQVETGDDFSDSNIIRTGSLYNKFIQSGDFFHLPINSTAQNVYDITKTEYRIVTPSSINDSNTCCHIIYDYLFY